MRTSFVKLLIFTFVACFGPTKAWSAEDDWPSKNFLPRFEVSLYRDIPLVVGSAAISLYGNYRASQMDKPLEDEIRPESRLLPWDKPIAGRYDENAARASQYVAVLGAMPLVLGGISIARDEATWGEFGAFTLMFAEALAIQNGINMLARSLEVWPRPYIYGKSGEALREAEDADAEAYGSFFSGHASAAFMVATFTSEWFSTIYPNSPYKSLVWTSTMSLAGFVGVLRIAAGKHYPTDVAAGALVGTGVSLAVIRAHKKPLRIGGNQISFWAVPNSVGTVVSF